MDLPVCGGPRAAAGPSPPLQFPGPSLVAEYREPVIAATIVTPDRYLGKVMELTMVGG